MRYSVKEALKKHWILILVIPVLVYLSVQAQLRLLGYDYLYVSQIVRHLDVLNGTAGSPWAYRLFSAYLVEGLSRLTAFMFDRITIGYVFVGVRIIQNAFIFILAFTFYRRLGLSKNVAIIGLLLVAWSLSYAIYDSDLSFNTYFDIIFYLLAGWAVVSRKLYWLLPITLFAATNRETSVLIPFLALTHESFYEPFFKRDWRRAFRSEPFAIFGGSLLIYILIFVGVRLMIGPVRDISPYGHTAGIDMLKFNLSRTITYVELTKTFSAIPIVALYFYRSWPTLLKRLFWTMIPLWILVHFGITIVAETRLFLVPIVLVLIPAALMGLEFPRREAAK